MKPSFARLLACPGCRSSFDLHCRAKQGGEIMEGALLCRGCEASYPIRRGVPRFVSNPPDDAAGFRLQWDWFRDVQLDSANRTDESERTLAGVTGWTDADLRSKLVLDAGAGAGRFAEIVAAKGGEVVGIDLTSAVDAAFDNVGRRDGVHLAQADIFALPFRPGSFDLAYSIGVLHHVAEPRAAFERVAAMVRPGGALAVSLYAGYGPAHRFSDALRLVTTRLPLPLMMALSSLAIPLYYIYRLPLLGALLQLVCPISQHRSWRWRWLDTFDWYTPRYQWKFLYPEPYGWFRSAGFREITVFDEPIRMRGTREALQEPASAPQKTPRRRASAPLRVACLGGGTGLPVVLQGLKQRLFPADWQQTPARGRDQLTAIVTVADDGGSSGRLRRAYSLLAPGDIRNCLLALSEGEASFAPLFRFRFAGEGDVGGHSLGNLILAALSQVEGDFTRGVERAGEILSARGRVLPSTTSNVTLVADLEDGTTVAGESRIASSRSRIRRVRLEPANAHALPQALKALRAADLVVLGPGSLYTSLLPNLLVPEIVEAIRESGARVVVVMNIMTEPGETDRLTAADHLRALRRHVPGLPIHDVLVNSGRIPDATLREYATAGASPVEVDLGALGDLCSRVIERDLLADGAKLRHDPRKVAEALVELAAADSVVVEEQASSTLSFADIPTLRISPLAAEVAHA